MVTVMNPALRLSNSLNSRRSLRASCSLIGARLLTILNATRLLALNQHVSRVLLAFPKLCPLLTMPIVVLGAWTKNIKIQLKTYNQSLQNVPSVRADFQSIIVKYKTRTAFICIRSVPFEIVLDFPQRDKKWVKLGIQHWLTWRSLRLTIVELIQLCHVGLLIKNKDFEIKPCPPVVKKIQYTFMLH